MMRWARLGAGLFALLAAQGCRGPRCEDLTPEPLAGSYRGGGSLGPERLLDVTVEATEQRVQLTYTTLDGSKLRATYRVSKKSKMH
jgi:hypothetical protein